VLFVVAANVVIGIAGAFIGQPHLGARIGEFSGVLITFVPGLAVAIRRMHDIGRSGWWVLLNVAPFVGLLVLFWYCADSRCANRWGPNPKAPAPPRPLTLGSAVVDFN
jgi:uncharacterized membrane protein YhaH (DUF805 family)